MDKKKFEELSIGDEIMRLDLRNGCKQVMTVIGFEDPISNNKFRYLNIKAVGKACDNSWINLERDGSKSCAKYSTRDYFYEVM